MTPKTTNQPQATIDELIRSLGFEETATRNSDRLDFHEVHVASLREALEKAYAAGLVASRRATSRTKSR